MKRIFSVFLCIAMLLGMCSLSFGVTALDETDDLFSRFEDEISYIALFANHVPEGEKYPIDAIFYYTQSEMDLDKYGYGEPIDYDGYLYYECYSVPADVFEAEVASHFVVDEALIAELRAYESGPWDPETMTCAPIYDEATDSYLFFVGGLGDSCGYSTYGYVANGNRYDVYLYYVERDYQLTDDAVLGEDYILEMGWNDTINLAQILEYAKFTVEYDGEAVKFLWSEKIESLPAIDGMVVREPLDVVMDDNFIYTPKNDGKELWASTYCGAAVTEITIPAAVNGVPVTGVTCYFSMLEGLQKVNLPDSLTYIGDYTFNGLFELSEITLPAGLTTIGDSAFGYSGLTEVDIPAGVKSIGEQAFCACSELGAINVAEDNAAYASVDGVLFNKKMDTLLCYPASKAAAEYDIPAGVTTIARGAFRDAYSLKAVTIPDSVTTIEAMVFAYSGLTSVTIPAGVTKIKNYTFNGCTELASVTLPVGLTVIEDGAFMMSGLTSVVLPEGLTEIGSSAFGTNSLESVVFPSSLQKIGSYCFPGGETLTSAIYIGTEEEWALVKKDTNWSSGETEAVVTFAAPVEDETSGVQVFNSDGASFAEDVTLSVQPVTDEETLSKLEDYENAMVLDITLLKNGEETQPEAAVTVRVPVPEGMDGEKCRIFRVEEDGTLTDMNAYFLNGMLVFSTEHFSHYAVVESSTILGDADGNGKVNTTDARKVLQYAAGVIGEDGLNIAAADADKNGKVNTTDARRILQYAAGVIEEF